MLTVSFTATNAKILGSQFRFCIKSRNTGVKNTVITVIRLSTPLSVIAGLVMGEFSVKSGWFNAEVMLYMAFVAVANYTQPNFELGYALKFMRLELLILTAIFNWWGFAIGCVVILCSICFNKTLSGRSYLNVKLN